MCLDCGDCVHCRTVSFEFGGGGLYMACTHGPQWSVISGQCPQVCPAFEERRPASEEAC